MKKYLIFAAIVLASCAKDEECTTCYLVTESNYEDAQAAI